MGALSRNKGRRGEQEAASLIRDWLGCDVTRNWAEQSAQGGSDLSGVPGWSVEIKRASVASIRKWWEQTTDQASRCGAMPVLLYRIDREGHGLDPLDKWRAVVYLHHICRFDCDQDAIATITLRAWLDIARETIGRSDL
jgi:hypothetical protein